MKNTYILQKEFDQYQMEGGAIHQNLLEHEAESWLFLKSKIWNETKKLWVVAAPAILIPCSTFGIYVITQAFIGHFSSTQLAAYALISNVSFQVVLGVQVHYLYTHKFGNKMRQYVKKIMS